MRALSLVLISVALLGACQGGEPLAPEVGVAPARDGAAPWVRPLAEVEESSGAEVWGPQPETTEEETRSDPPPSTGAEDAEDLSAAMFDPERLLDVQITLSPEDWETLRHQTRTPFDVFGEGCMEGPFESPFTYFKGRVSVDGEVVEEVGVRKKGFLGSLSTERPSLKIKFGEYVDDQELSGLKRMTLNNSRQDVTFQRQCLTYQLFRQAGLVAPRCNWAKVTVNGHFLGIYNHIDSIKKPFIRRNFPDESGTLWEGTLSDFRPGWMATFQQKLNKKSDDNQGLVAVVEALETSDEALLEALDTWIDMDAFFSFWAMETLTGHWDGYTGNTNNYYLYERPDDGHRLTFIPWGSDGTFMGMGSPEQQGVAGLPKAVMTTSALALRLYQVPETRMLYLTRLQELLTALFDIEALSDAVNARAAWLKPHLPVEAAAQMEEGLAWVHQFLASRPAEVQAELDQGGVSWNPPLRDVLCMHKRGTLEATYETVWGSLHTQDPMVAGAATFAGTLDGEPLEFDQLGAASNVGEGEAADKAMVAVFGRKGAVEMKILVLQTPLANFLPQSVIPIDWEMGMASLMKMRMQQDSAPQHVGFLSDALWVVDEAGQTPGAPVSGSVSGTLYSWDK